MKIAIVADSNSGVTQDEAKELGIYVLPMPFMIDGQVFYEGIDLSHEDFYARMEEGAEITTSQPSPKDVTEQWEQLLEDHDQVVYIPMSSGLSGSCQTALMLAEDYEGRVQVVNNQRISVTQRQSALDARDLAERGWSGEQIKEKLEATRFDSSIYITVDTLKYLKKGGRITPAAATLGAVLNIKPILTTVGEKFDAIEKVRGMKKSLAKLLDYTEEFVNKTLAEKPDAEIRIGAAGTFTNDQAAEEWYNEVKERFPNVKDIYYNPLSFSICCHTGPDAVGIGVSVILRDE